MSLSKDLREIIKKWELLNLQYLKSEQRNDLVRTLTPFILTFQKDDRHNKDKK